MNRAEFIKKGFKALALGLLTHFTLLGGGTVNAKADNVPQDTCHP